MVWELVIRPQILRLTYKNRRTTALNPVVLLTLEGFNPFPLLPRKRLLQRPGTWRTTGSRVVCSWLWGGKSVRLELLGSCIYEFQLVIN